MKDFELNELFLASDGNDKYFYGEIERHKKYVVGKIYIRDHVIISSAINDKFLGNYLDDTVYLILNYNILDLIDNINPELN